MILTLFALAFLALCLFAAMKDINSHTIPNWLNLAIAGLFLPAAAVSGIPLEIIGGHLLAAGLAFVVAFGLFSLRVFGGGDAKMIPAVMLWLGPAAAMPFLFWMAIAGGACALLILAVRKTIPVEYVPGPVRAPFQPAAGVPYGVAITTGVLVAATHSPFLSGTLSLIGVHG